MAKQAVAGMNGIIIREYTTFPRQFLAYRWYKPLLVGALALVFMVMFQIVVLSLGALWPVFGSGPTMGLGFFDALGDMGDPSTFTVPGMIVEFGGVAVILPALALAVLIVRDRPFSSYSSSRGGFSWTAFFKCLGVAAVVYGAFTALELVFFPDEDATGIVAFTAGGFALGIVLVPLQCVAEEYLFRGLFLQTISSWAKLPAVGIAISSLIFAAAHEYNIDVLAAIFAGAIVWGVLAWQTKGIEATCAAHIMNNMMGVYTVGFGVATLSDATSEIDIAGMVVVMAIDVVYAAAVVFLGKRFNWFPQKGDGVAKANEAYLAAKARKQKAVPNPPPLEQSAPISPGQGEAPSPPRARSAQENPMRAPASQEGFEQPQSPGR